MTIVRSCSSTLPDFWFIWAQRHRLSDKPLFISRLRNSDRPCTQTVGLLADYHWSMDYIGMWICLWMYFTRGRRWKGAVNKKKQKIDQITKKEGWRRGQQRRQRRRMFKTSPERAVSRGQLESSASIDPCLSHTHRLHWRRPFFFLRILPLKRGLSNRKRGAIEDKRERGQ